MGATGQAELSVGCEKPGHGIGDTDWTSVWHLTKGKIVRIPQRVLGF